jgi:hypothetical protein
VHHLAHTFFYWCQASKPSLALLLVMVVLLLPLVALFSARVPAVRAQDEQDDDPSC